MRADPPSSELTPDDRVREISSIFATGILQLRARVAIPTPSTQNPAEKPENQLDLVLDSLLSVHTG